MKPPVFEWNGEFKYNGSELELIDKINSFLTRPLSPRWIYYGLFNEPDVKQQKMLSKVLNKSRKDIRQLINRGLVTDDTRTPTMWRSNQDLVEFITELTYIRDIWQDQPKYMEIWMEDQASLEAVKKSPRQILQKYRFNARYCKGFNSIGAMWNAYKFFEELNKPITILYYGDLNPSGWAIPVIIVRQFKEMGLDISLERLALNPKQLEEYNIPLFTKISADPRRKEFNMIFGFEEWENQPLQPYIDENIGKTKHGKKHLNIDLEKVPIDTFEDLLEQNIREYLDMNAYEESIEKEHEESEELNIFKENI